MEQTDNTKTLRLSASALKTIALATMFIDHLGFTVVDRLEHMLRSDIGPTGPVTAAMRMIGRIAFILFAFLLVEGFSNTSDKRKYVTRLLAGAVISEIPFDLAAAGGYFDPWDQNIFFTLAIGFCTIWLLDLLRKKREEAGTETEENGQISVYGGRYIRSGLISLSGILIVIAGMAAAELIRCDYASMGVGLIVVFYLFRWHPARFWAALVWSFAGHILADVIGYVVSIYRYCLRTGQPFYLKNVLNAEALRINLLGSAQYRIVYTMPGILVALLMILRYNGEKGRQLPKAFYYLFYPVHLLILYLLTRIMR